MTRFNDSSRSAQKNDPPFPPNRLLRRNFLRFLTAGASLSLLNWPALAEGTATPDILPIVPEVPLTPFDAPVGTWSLALLPDTQYYSQDHPDVFIRQTEWLVKNREKHRILFMLHEGDIVNVDLPVQWENARKALDVLKGQLPYALSLGNHDYDMSKPGGRSTLINEYFTAKDYQQNESVGFFEEGKMENSWHTFTAPTGKFMVLALEFGPRDEVLVWANQIAARHPEHTIIVVTHAHTYWDSTLFDWAKYGEKQAWNPKIYPMAKVSSVNDGMDVWNKLVSQHPNMRFVFNGHVVNNGTGYVVGELSNGAKVHQILANYQTGVIPDRGYGGGGYMRLMQFLPDGKTVRVRSYSPLYDHWLTDPSQQFELQLS